MYDILLYLYVVGKTLNKRKRKFLCWKGGSQSTDKRNQMSDMLIAPLNIIFDDQLLYPCVTIWSYSIGLDRTNNLEYTKFSDHQNLGM